MRHVNTLTRSPRWRAGTRRNKRWRGPSRYGIVTRAEMDQLRAAGRRLAQLLPLSFGDGLIVGRNEDAGSGYNAAGAWLDECLHPSGADPTMHV